MSTGIYIPGNVTAETFYYLSEGLPFLIASKPGDTFLLIAPKEFHDAITEHPNLVRHLLPGKPKRGWIQQWWEYKQLPKLLVKNNILTLVHTSDRIHLPTKLQQLVLLADNHASILNKKLNSTSFEKTKGIGVLSEYAWNALVGNKMADTQKITILPVPHSSQYLPLSWEEKEEIKNRYTEGKEYFLCEATGNGQGELVNLLKAFSLFKKRQHSNMQLVITNLEEKSVHLFREKLDSYKFRADVKLLPDVNKASFAHLKKAAYGIINNSTKPGLSLLQLNAISSGVPFIAGTKHAEPQVEGGLYADPKLPEEMAEQMKMLYKNEHLRSELIIKGVAMAKNYSAETCASALWQWMEQTVITH